MLLQIKNTIKPELTVRGLRVACKKDTIIVTYTNGFRLFSFKNHLNDFRKLNPEKLAELGVTILPGYEDMSLKR